MNQIRTELRDGECLSWDIQKPEKMFLGQISGVVLYRRQDDNHVVFSSIRCDDDGWFKSNAKSSSAWFEDFISVLQAAQKWCEENCAPDISDNRQYGWKFKE